jgi:hypothetical protein
MRRSIEPCSKGTAARQFDVKEMERWQIQNGDIQRHGATGGAPMTT